MPAPVNVKIEKPTITIRNWGIQEFNWIALNDGVGNKDFYPLTIKAAYVIGIIHDICQSVSILLENDRNSTCLPAFGIFSSGIDLLGRCITGNDKTTNSGKDLETGFKWLVSSNHQTIPNTYELVSTTQGQYQINRLVALRHFSAHGQATPEPIHSVDNDLLGKLSPLLASGLQRYWDELQTDADLCNLLAQANVAPLRDLPIETSWKLFEKDRFGKYHSVFEIFSRFDWR